MHGLEQAQMVMRQKFMIKVFQTNRKARRMRIVNRMFCKKGYRFGIKIKVER